MVIPTIHFRSEYSSIPLRIAKGHFATSHSHLNYYIDMTYTKHRLSEAREAAKELAIQLQDTRFVDTILCLDGTEVLGACLAEALIDLGVRNKNEHNTIYVLSPEYTSGSQYIFRENTAHLIQNRHVLLLAASVTTGNTVRGALEAVRYYGGEPVGVCSIFSCLEECEGFPVTAIFYSGVLDGYQCLPSNQCPLCRAGVRLDGLVNSYGISSFYR
ncbi:MAG: phosphoribosyltransferase [Oscillospiraceae bacterium]|nr:phosphoribosyltransferase [Oscillospiraceae bacterium]